jgi:hypothetical protein
MTPMNVLITSSVEKQDDGKWIATWHVGTRSGQATFDTEEEAKDYNKRNINRETGFTG